MVKIKKRGKKISITFDNKRESSNLLRAVGFKNIPALQDEQAVEHGVHVDVAPCGHTEDQMELMLEDGKFYCKVCGALRQ